MLLAHALKVLKARSAKGHEQEMAAALDGLPDAPPAQALPLLARMGLQQPAGRDELGQQKTVMLALRLAGIV